MPRLRFAKEGNSIWISHLDLMRVFQRSFRRGGILLRHSQGFTPRPYVSIALPLPVGMASRCELLDFELMEGDSTPLTEIPARLNQTLPAGLMVLDAYERGRKLRELSLLEAELVFEYDQGIPPDAERAISSLIERTSLPVTKHTKRGMAELDIRPMLRRLDSRQIGENELCIYCCVSAQNPTLNPMLLAEAVRRYLPAYAPSFCKANRVEILDASGNPFR